MSKVELLIQGHIAHIQLNRPEKLNAIDRDMLVDLGEFVEQLDRSDQARVVLIRAWASAPSASAPISMPGHRLPPWICGDIGYAMAIACSIVLRRSANR